MTMAAFLFGLVLTNHQVQSRPPLSAALGSRLGLSRLTVVLPYQLFRRLSRGFFIFFPKVPLCDKLRARKSPPEEGAVFPFPGGYRSGDQSSCRLLSRQSLAPAMVMAKTNQNMHITRG